MNLTVTRSRIGWWAAVAALVAIPVFILHNSPAGSSGSQVTRGEFRVFAAGVGDPRFADLRGHAQMVRAADGKTIVKVEVTGLVPDTTYPVHVHAAACDVGSADGHFQFQPGGAVDSYNELWPGFTTNPAGAGNGMAVADRTAGEKAVSVVIHSPDATPAPKVACADLK
ncbi:MAG TPA: hypothetical protein VGL92_08560 [Acidimicrobiia bacterium]|jgi:phosphodiesterase/alkaline phosphatase D-like protein